MTQNALTLEVVMTMPLEELNARLTIARELNLLGTSAIGTVAAAAPAAPKAPTATKTREPKPPKNTEVANAPRTAVDIELNEDGTVTMTPQQPPARETAGAPGAASGPANAVTSGVKLEALDEDELSPQRPAASASAPQTQSTQAAVSRDDLITLAKKLVSSGGAGKVKAVTVKYNINKVSEAPENQLAAIFADLSAA